ncbi:MULTISPECIES: LPD25 domain-containing protein [unclassified Marinobacter]|uniref:LPD25 domain-containing protein n=1 Tax=unclassified Marinobacter TaxID=83889 RepID=UPI001269832F|nr:MULTISPECIES: LPD25 domain-containing protein [unclassified Marinobacter]QFS87575.1 hypothetical protein FIV08_12150 [Marinobacter sp. THAF197a]QFT51360.1 hypothetical protein FIU96_12065 [Marinobacter sp. THAF39]
MKPVSVLVHWSESRRFMTDNTVMPFEKFEQTARMAANDNPPGSGYDKTKITVNFDNGEEYACRLDLCQNEDCDFQSHARELIKFAGSERLASMHPETQNQYKQLADFLNQIDWS